MDVKQANGLLKVTGQTDLTYTIGGMGSVDISKAGKGNPAFNELNAVSLPGHTVNAGNDHGWVTFDPYYQITYQMATFNGTSEDDFDNSVAAFNGIMSTRTITDLGDFEVFFPPSDPDASNAEDKNRDANKISVSRENVLYSSPGQGGKIAVGTYVKFGLKVSFFLFGGLFKWDVGLPDVSVCVHIIIIKANRPTDVDHVQYHDRV
jgi:chitinase